MDHFLQLFHKKFKGRREKKWVIFKYTTKHLSSLIIPLTTMAEWRQRFSSLLLTDITLRYASHKESPVPETRVLQLNSTSQGGKGMHTWRDRGDINGTPSHLIETCAYPDQLRRSCLLLSSFRTETSAMVTWGMPSPLPLHSCQSGWSPPLHTKTPT